MYFPAQQKWELPRRWWMRAKTLVQTMVFLDHFLSFLF